ncbi:MAG: hypothetical protein IPK65_01570 [Gammaproteobacteria bacterium]|nr:hypothetical protein [Gammaproteobacteria bacterium]
MNKTKRAISSIYIAAMFTLAGCAGSGAMNNDDSSPASGGNTAAANAEMPACRSAIDDVTRLCTGDDASTGKCNDAKARTREHCID